METLAKQDYFWCWSASKTINGHCHTRCWEHLMLEAKTFTASTPPPPLNGQVPKYECWLQVTGLFHFCLDKSAVLSFFLLHFHYRSNCINMAQPSIVILFSPNASKKPLKLLRKPLNHQLLSDRRKQVQQWLDDRFSGAQAWRGCWHWKVQQLSVTLVLQTLLCHIKFILKRGRSG